MPKEKEKATVDMPEETGADEKNVEKTAESAETAEETKETPEPVKEAEKPEAGEAGEGSQGEPEESEAEPEASDEAETGEEAGEDEAGRGRRFWQKQNKPPKKDKKDELIDELNDKVARQLAEFENFRKRTEKEKMQNYTIGAKDALEKILPVLDNFERGLANADLSDPFVEGMDKVYKQFVTTLESLGVTPIDAAGKEFDPNFHNAVMHVEDESLGENIVAEELQKGYMYKDQVLRYSMVKVAN